MSTTHPTSDSAPVEDQSVETWSEEELEEESFLENPETTALIGSMLVHLIIILTLALVPLRLQSDPEAVVIVSPPKYDDQEVEMIEEVTYSEVEQTEVGANSVADSEMAEASAEMFAEVSEIPTPTDLEPVDLGQIMVNKMFDQAVAPLDRLTEQKGSVGEGTEGAAGAIDRVTFEILKMMEERPTQVVWLFDESGSLHQQRQEIRERFDRIYHELGIAEKNGKKEFRRNNNDSPLLTSIIGFGNDVTLYTEEPTDNLEEIKAIVSEIEIDSSGEEKVFSAVKSAADEFKSLRRRRGTQGPQRNVMFIVVTDERGDDAMLLEKAIEECRRWAIPVYVIGVPAPFGRGKHTRQVHRPRPEIRPVPSVGAS